MQTLLVLGLLMGGMAGASRLTEAQRLTVWKTLDAADVRTSKLVNATYNVCVPHAPQAVLQANAALLDRKTRQFEKAVMQTYHLTERQLDGIYIEGTKKHWPQRPDITPGC